MLIWVPGAAVTGALRSATTRSARVIWIGAAAARQLLVSLSSLTLRKSSAHARRVYVASDVVEGMVTVAEPDWLVPAARLGTAREPLRRMSPEERALPDAR